MSIITRNWWMLCKNKYISYCLWKYFLGKYKKFVAYINGSNSHINSTCIFILKISTAHYQHSCSHVWILYAIYGFIEIILWAEDFSWIKMKQCHIEKLCTGKNTWSIIETSTFNLSVRFISPNTSPPPPLSPNLTLMFDGWVCDRFTYGDRDYVSPWAMTTLWQYCVITV